MALLGDIQMIRTLKRGASLNLLFCLTKSEGIVRILRQNIHQLYISENWIKSEKHVVRWRILKVALKTFTLENIEQKIHMVEEICWTFGDSFISKLQYRSSK